VCGEDFLKRIVKCFPSKNLQKQNIMKKLSSSLKVDLKNFFKISTARFLSMKIRKSSSSGVIA
jgi:hypothetical protein